MKIGCTSWTDVKISGHSCRRTDREAKNEQIRKYHISWFSPSMYTGKKVWKDSGEKACKLVERTGTTELRDHGIVL